MIKSGRKNDLFLATIYINPLQHVSTLFFDLQWRCSLKKDVLKTFANFTGKHLYWTLFLIELQALQAPQLYQKKNPAQVFSCGICETFKNICKRLLLTSANDCFWFLQEFNLDMLRDKRSRFNRIFQKDETTIPPIQKQSSGGVLQKSYPQIFRKKV